MDTTKLNAIKSQIGTMIHCGLSDGTFYVGKSKTIMSDDVSDLRSGIRAFCDALEIYEDKAKVEEIKEFAQSLLEMRYKHLETETEFCEQIGGEL